MGEKFLSCPMGGAPKLVVRCLSEICGKNCMFLAQFLLKNALWWIAVGYAAIYKMEILGTAVYLNSGLTLPSKHSYIFTCSIVNCLFFLTADYILSNLTDFLSYPDRLNMSVWPSWTYMLMGESAISVDWKIFQSKFSECHGQFNHSLQLIVYEFR